MPQTDKDVALQPEGGTGTLPRQSSEASSTSHGRRSASASAPLRGEDRWIAWVPWVAAAAAAAVLAWGIATRTGLSIDEAWSVSIADRPLASTLHVIAVRERNMALYFTLLHFWVALSDDVRWLAVLSALAAVAAVLAIGWVGRLVAGARVAAIASLLAAANASLAAYGIELRGYSLDVLLATLTTGCFLRLLTTGLATGRRRWAVAFAVAALAFTATTVLSALLILALALVALTRPEGRRRTVLGPLVGVGVVIAGWDAFVLTTDQGNVSWIPPTTLGELASTAVILAGGKVGLVLTAVALVAFVLQLRRGVSTPALVVLAWLVVPIIGLLAFSTLDPLLVPRYILFVVPAITLAAGLVLAPRRHGVAIGALAAVVIALTGLSGPWRAQDNDIAGGASFLLRHQQPGDAVVYDPAAARAWYGHYLGTWASDQERPRDLALAAGGNPWQRGDTYGREVPAAQVAQRAAGVRRLWVVSYPDWGGKRLTPEPFRAVEHQVLAGRRPSERWRSGDAVITLYVKG